MSTAVTVTPLNHRTLVFTESIGEFTRFCAPGKIWRLWRACCVGSKLSAAWNYLCVGRSGFTRTIHTIIPLGGVALVATMVADGAETGCLAKLGYWLVTFLCVCVWYNPSITTVGAASWAVRRRERACSTQLLVCTRFPLSGTLQASKIRKLPRAY